MSPQTQPRSGGPAPMRRSPLPDPARKPVSVKRRPSKSRSKSPANKAEKLPIKRKGIPLWLRSLVLLQKSTSLLLFLAVGATVTVYSWKEQVETEWSKEYKQLNTLLQEERELTATNEILKNQIANQAEKEETGLAPLTPTKNIFLEPVPYIHQEAEVTATATKKLPPSNTPLGY